MFHLRFIQTESVFGKENSVNYKHQSERTIFEIVSIAAFVLRMSTSVFSVSIIA